MRKLTLVAAGLLVSLVLGATVFREPVAWAAQSLDARIVGPLDGGGNVAVHEQGTASVAVRGTVETLPQIPSTAFSAAVYNNALLIGPDPAGTSYAITSLTIANHSGHEIPLASLIGAYGQDCMSSTFVFSLGPTVNLLPNATVHLAFPQPFVVAAKPGSQSCLRLDPSPAGGGDNLAVTVAGYRL